MNGAGPRPGGRGPARGLSLQSRVLITNVGVLVLAGVVLATVAPAAGDRRPVTPAELAVLVLGIALLTLTNLILLRRAFSPLRRLAEVMGRVDYQRPGLRIPEYGADADIIRLTRAFNEMLDHLERERADSIRRATEAQESERLRVAQELHDDVGQSLTALKLMVERAARASGTQRDAALREAADVADYALTDIRQIASRLRPELLDHLGLRRALIELVDRVSAPGGVAIDQRFEAPSQAVEVDLDVELAVYRIAQEALTNVMRHSGAERAWVTLEQEGDEITLVVRDDGRGLERAAAGNGIRGMRERAVSIGGTLTIGSGPQGGTEVRLAVPRHQAAERPVA